MRRVERLTACITDNACNRIAIRARGKRYVACIIAVLDLYATAIADNAADIAFSSCRDVTAILKGISGCSIHGSARFDVACDTACIVIRSTGLGIDRARIANRAACRDAGRKLADDAAHIRTARHRAGICYGAAYRDGVRAETDDAAHVAAALDRSGIADCAAIRDLAVRCCALTRDAARIVSLAVIRAYRTVITDRIDSADGETRDTADVRTRAFDRAGIRRRAVRCAAITRDGAACPTCDAARVRRAAPCAAHRAIRVRARSRDTGGIITRAEGDGVIRPTDKAAHAVRALDHARAAIRRRAAEGGNRLAGDAAHISPCARYRILIGESAGKRAAHVAGDAARVRTGITGYRAGARGLDRALIRAAADRTIRITDDAAHAVRARHRVIIRAARNVASGFARDAARVFTARDVSAVCAARHCTCRIAHDAAHELSVILRGYRAGIRDRALHFVCSASDDAAHVIQRLGGIAHVSAVLHRCHRAICIADDAAHVRARRTRSIILYHARVMRVRCAAALEGAAAVSHDAAHVKTALPGDDLLRRRGFHFRIIRRSAFGELEISIDIADEATDRRLTLDDFTACRDSDPRSCRRSRLRHVRPADTAADVISAAQNDGVGAATIRAGDRRARIADETADVTGA